MLNYCRAANVSRRREASDRVSLKIFLRVCIYNNISIYVCSHLAQADAAVVQALMAILCTLYVLH